MHNDTISEKESKSLSIYIDSLILKLVWHALQTKQ